MTGYLIAFAVTLVFCSVFLSILVHTGFIDKDDNDLVVGLVFVVIICSLLWFVFWPVFLTVATVYVIYSLVGKLLFKGNKDA